MIISQLNGGLGNQMFQYTLGRVLALKHNTDLYLDLNLFKTQPNTDTKRQYELNAFSLPVKIATPDLVKNFVQSNIYKVLLNRYFNLNLNLSSDKYIKESGHQFHPEILKLPNDIYLSGYWQTEKYFLKYKTTITRDFLTRKKPTSDQNKKILNQINRSKSVSLHVRRTDYVTNRHANAYHGICDLSYYIKAMKLIEKDIEKATYFIFSDDPKWVKENIKPKHQVTYITHNIDSNSHEDLRLMSQCQHNIIANSSFSWWGAWLNQNNKKIVIAPKHWIQDKTVNKKDIIPKEWIKI
jgi:hypothetical protein